MALHNTESFDPGALLGRSYLLSGGLRVRLRLVHGRDLVAIRRLCEQEGVPIDELDLARLVRPDPRYRLVLCATALIGAAESLVAVGAIELDEDDGIGEPCFMVLDAYASEDLRALLRNALVGRAKAIARDRAA